MYTDWNFLVLIFLYNRGETYNKSLAKLEETAVYIDYEK